MKINTGSGRGGGLFKKAVQFLNPSSSVKHADDLLKKSIDTDIATVGKELNTLKSAGSDADKIKNISKDLGFNMQEGENIMSYKARVAKELKGEQDILAKQQNDVSESTMRVVGERGETGRYMGNIMKDYFTGGSLGRNMGRTALAASGYAGGATAMRYATGGNMKRNGNGKKDIVGIPFI